MFCIFKILFGIKYSNSIVIVLVISVAFMRLQYKIMVVILA